MAEAKQHHWWPRCVAEFWTNEKGFVQRIDPSGKVISLKPAKAARIGNAHAVRMGKEGEPSVWDDHYEHVFQNADDQFPGVIRALQKFDNAAISGRDQSRFSLIDLERDTFAALIEGVVSLAVRVPAFRERCVGLAEHLRGPLPERERNKLIGANQRHCQEGFAKQFLDRSVATILFADGEEFIYGDGIYSTLTPPPQPGGSLGDTILAAITPKMAILLHQPMAYSPDRQLSCTKLAEDETAFFNRIVQIHSKDYLFFRTGRPLLDEAFLVGKHCELSGHPHPVREFAKTLPGVSDRQFGF